jgi:hypothetical protein
MNMEEKRKLLSKIREPKSGRRDKLIILRVSGEQKAKIKETAKKLRCSMSRYLLGLHEYFNG